MLQVATGPTLEQQFRQRLDDEKEPQSVIHIPTGFGKFVCLLQGRCVDAYLHFFSLVIKHRNPKARRTSSQQMKNPNSQWTQNRQPRHRPSKRTVNGHEPTLLIPRLQTPLSSRRFLSPNPLLKSAVPVQAP
jgi:hypothetical protein